MVIRKGPVTLTVAEAETVFGILTDFARCQWDHARTTKSAAIREDCERRGTSARDLREAIVRRLYEQSWQPGAHTMLTAAEMRAAARRLLSAADVLSAAE